jgi:ribokinase
MSVVVFGGINMDLVTYVPRLPEPGETLVGHSFMTFPGGKGANQAVACARLDLATKMVGRVGKDTYGEKHLQALNEEGVDTSSVLIDIEQSTGLAVISVDDAAENSIVVISGANAILDAEDVSRAAALLAEAEILLIQNEVPIEANFAVARAAHDRGVTVVFDPAPAGLIPEESLSYLDWITPNEVEAEALVGFSIQNESQAVKAAEELCGIGIGTAVIKMGERGACFSSEEGSGMVPAFKVDAIDTVAAGDAFNAGLAAGIAAKHPIEECVRWGTAAGALAVTKRGAISSLPYRTELENLLTTGIVS